MNSRIDWYSLLAPSFWHSISSSVFPSLTDPLFQSGVGVSSASHSLLWMTLFHSVFISPFGALFTLCVCLCASVCGLKMWTHLLHPPYLQRQGQVLSQACVHLIAISQETLQLESYIYTYNRHTCTCMCTVQLSVFTRPTAQMKWRCSQEMCDFHFSIFYFVCVCVSVCSK